MERREQLIGVVWLVISILLCLESIQIDIGSAREPGPGFLPFWSAVTLGMSSVILIVVSIFSRKQQQKIIHIWKGVKWENTIVVLTSLFIYALLLPKIGYLITTFGLMVLLFSILGKSKLWVRVVGSMICVLLTYIVFYSWLNVHLPRGIFSF